MEKNELIGDIIDKLVNAEIEIYDCPTCRWNENEDGTNYNPDDNEHCNECRHSSNWRISERFSDTIKSIIDLVEKNTSK